MRFFERYKQTYLNVKKQKHFIAFLKCPWSLENEYHSNITADKASLKQNLLCIFDSVLTSFDALVDEELFLGKYNKDLDKNSNVLFSNTTVPLRRKIKCQLSEQEG